MKQLHCSLIVVLGLWLSACDTNTFSESFITNLPEAGLTLSGSGGSVDFNLNSSYTWTVVEKPTWLTLDPMQGSGGKSLITATVPANSSGGPQNGTILLRSSTGTRITVLVTHAGLLTFTPNSMDVPATAETNQVSVNSNATWTVSWNSTLYPWITGVTPVSNAAGNRSVSVVCLANNTADSRSAVLVFTTPDGQTANLSITQAAAFVVTSTATLAGGAGDNIVSVTANRDWTNVTVPNDIIITNITPIFGANGATNLTITCAKNTIGTSRDVTLTFTGPDSQTATLTLSQAAAPIYAVGDYYPNATNPIGVVFETSEEGVSGKMVSLRQTAGVAWSTLLISTKFITGGVGYWIEASSTTDGVANRDAVKVFVDDSALLPDRTWASFPAFQWVTDNMNGGVVDGPWYIPATDELKAMADWFRASNGNAQFTDKGGVAMNTTSPSYYYSSRGSWDYDNRNIAQNVDMNDGAVSNSSNHSSVTDVSYHFVRAIRKF